MIEEIRKKLYSLADADYKVFNDKLIPGTDNAIGIRLPKLREIAKEIAKGDFRTYLFEAENTTHEEVMLQGLVIGYAEMDLDECFSYLDQFVPKIYNWAICDSCCMTYCFMKKFQEESFAYLQKYLNSDREFEIRFGVVSLLDHFVNETYIDEVLEICGRIRHDGYYVKMAVAWAVSVCYVKFPKKTKVFLLENTMDDFTHNKSIQKIRESYRVSKEEKELLNQLKRK